MQALSLFLSGATVIGRSCRVMFADYVSMHAEAFLLLFAVCVWSCMAYVANIHRLFRSLLPFSFRMQKQRGYSIERTVLYGSFQ